LVHRHFTIEAPDDIDREAARVAGQAVAFINTL
jgi:hypothetical protein